MAEDSGLNTRGGKWLVERTTTGVYEDVPGTQGQFGACG